MRVANVLDKKRVNGARLPVWVTSTLETGDILSLQVRVNLLKLFSGRRMLRGFHAVNRGSNPLEDAK